MTFARAAILLLVLGLALMLVGFGTDPLWPAQDATPEMTRQAAEQAVIAGWIYTAGMLALVGAAACLVAAAIRRARR